MKYAVVVTKFAADQIDEAYMWLIERTPLHAPEWYDGLLNAIASLESFPHRCPLLPPDED